MTFARRIAFALALVCGLGLLAAPSAPAQNPGSENAQHASWSDEKWPFPIDQWGTGRAFTCPAEQCGSELHLYLRTKIGFCRCATGVSDDDEIDRVGDLELIGADYKPLAPGHPVAAGIMRGRARRFAVARTFQSPMPVLTIALANKCDAIVATVVAAPEVQSAEEDQALAFLRSAAVQDWVEGQSGSE